MAKLDTVHLTASIVKVEKAADDPDARYVYGICTSDDLDLDEQIVDKAATRKALTAWFEDWANVRQMHSNNLPPAGKGVLLEEKPDGFWLRTRVIEPTAVKLVDERVYQAYSIGIHKYRMRNDPKARKGRVLPEVISEVSLVDSPALPKARFTLAKRADSGDIVEVAEVADLSKVAGAEVCKCSQDCQACLSAVCDTCELHGHAAGTVDKASMIERWMLNPAIVKRNFDQSVGGGVDRDKIPAEDFAGPGRTYPIVTPGDVQDAASLVGKADDPDAVRRRIVAVARRKGPDFVAQLPDSWKDSEKTEKAAIPPGKQVDTELEEHREPDGDEDGPDLDRDGDGTEPATKQAGAGLQALHDAVCPAVEIDLAGLGKLLDPTPLAQHVSALLVQDAGSGRNAGPIAKLSAAYGHATLLWASDPQLLAEVRSELAKAMTAPHAKPMSKPQGESTLDPSQFQRGALQGGHQTEPGRETAPRIPRADPARAGDFRQDTLEAGHQSPSPAAGKAGRTFYTRAAAAQARDAMQVLHDHIAAMYPDLCPVTTQERMEEPAVDLLPNSDDSTLIPKASETELGKATETEELETSPVEEPEVSEIELTKALGGLLPDLVKTAVADALADHRAAVDEEVGELRKMVEQLASEPDPAKAPMRGTAVVVAERRSAAEDAQERAKQADADERRAYYERLAMSPIPAIRMAAEQHLAKLAG